MVIGGSADTTNGDFMGMRIFTTKTCDINKTYGYGGCIVRVLAYPVHLTEQNKYMHGASNK
jgi:hypothetical protein